MSYLTGNFITEPGKKAIKEHKYKSGAYAPIDKLFNPFWMYSVNFLPTWMAPNLITLIGFL